MIPIPVPDEAKAGRPDCRLVDMGRPRGVPEEECGSAEMLIGDRPLTNFAGAQYAYLRPTPEELAPLTNFAGRAQYAYFRPTPEELALLNAGGFLEMCQIGTVVQPFSLVVWPVSQELPNEGAAGDGVAEQGDAGRNSTASGPRDGADSHDVGHAAPEAAPADENGAVGGSSARRAPTGVTTDRDDPRLTRGVDTEPVPMAEAYLVLSDEERAKGFVRPYRDTYRHDTCGTTTRMGQAIAETYAREPAFYGATFCVRCSMHRPVGEHGEFSWLDGSKVGT